MNNGKKMEPSDFNIGPKIGGRKTSEIYIGVHKKTKEVVAIKKESTKIEYPRLYTCLPREAKFLNILQGGTGIPDVHGFHPNKEYMILLMSLHGPNLEQLFNSCNKKFSLKTVLMLADQMIDRIEFMHSKFVVHLDITPDNFVMGLDEQHNHLVYVVDFARARKYLRGANKVHILMSETFPKHPKETMVPFASINYHLNIAQSRRDDLESLGYVLIYFLKGSLPLGVLYPEVLRGLAGNATLIKSPYIKELCKGHPSEFELYFEYCRSLRFDEEPDYTYVKKIFRDLFIREGFLTDYLFDWTIQQEQEEESSEQVNPEERHKKKQRLN